MKYLNAKKPKGDAKPTAKQAKSAEPDDFDQSIPF